jgi:hypothetical protein
MKIFEFGIGEATFGAGNPHMMALGDEGVGFEASPRRDQGASTSLGDAVRAADRVLNDQRLDISMSGDVREDHRGVAETNKLVRATVCSALEHRGDMDAATVIRLGLFVDEWRTFREAAIAKEVLDGMLADKQADLGRRALEWASRVSAIAARGRSDGGGPSSTFTSIPWKRIIIGTGVVAIVVFIWRLFRPSVEPRPGAYYEFVQPGAERVQHEEATPAQYERPAATNAE